MLLPGLFVVFELAFIVSTSFISFVSAYSPSPYTPWQEHNANKSLSNS